MDDLLLFPPKARINDILAPIEGKKVGELIGFNQSVSLVNGTNVLIPAAPANHVYIIKELFVQWLNDITVTTDGLQMSNNEYNDTFNSYFSEKVLPNYNVFGITANIYTFRLKNFLSKGYTVDTTFTTSFGSAFANGYLAKLVDIKD